MTLDQLLNAIEKRGADEAIWEIDQPLQLRVGGRWRPQPLPITNNQLCDLIESALLPSARRTWRTSSEPIRFSHGNFEGEVSASNGNVRLVLRHISSSPPLGAPKAREHTPSATAPVFADEPRPAIAPVAAPIPVVAPPAIPQTAPAAPTRGATATPPVATAVTKEWFYLLNGEQCGPATPQQMRHLLINETIFSDTMVWHEGMLDWEMVKMTALRSFIPKPLEKIVVNSSGSGQYASLPPEISSFNWAALLLPVPWAIAHNQWGWAIGIFLSSWLSGWIPYIGWIISLGLTIAFAVEANTLAWRWREWENVEHFRRVQSVWARWCLYIYIGLPICGAIAFFIAAMLIEVTP